jgi:phage shock protein C
MNTQKLWRKKDDKVIAGICSGLGQYFNSDPILFRFAFLALLFAGGSSIFIYIILWIVLPSEPFSIKSETIYTETIHSTDTENNIKEMQSMDSTSLVFGLLLISGGVLLLLNNLVPYLKMQKLWPVILIMIGLGLLFNKKKDKNN